MCGAVAAPSSHTPDTQHPSCNQAHKLERLFLAVEGVNWQPKATGDAFYQQSRSNTRLHRVGSGSLRMSASMFLMLAAEHCHAVAARNAR